MANDKPNTEHAQYRATQTARTTWTDIMEGTLKLRDKGKVYLPQFPAELDASYKDRKDTATLLNMSEKTRDIMVGLVFQGDITLGEDVPNQIVQLAEDIDNAGTHLSVFARQLFEDSFDGWSVVLVDSPTTRPETIEDERVLGLRPYWIRYKADQVVNWRYRVNPVSRATELTLIVFKEMTSEPKGMFENETVTRFRAFMLNDAGQVEYKLYRQVGDEKDGSTQVDFVEEGSGIIANLTKIPVAVCGTLGSPPPLADIALKNIEHYQTYSDYKSLMHKTCVPMFYVKDYQPSDGLKLLIAPDKLTELGKDGDMGWAEVSGSALAPIRDTLNDIQDEIALMGLSLLADPTDRVEMTATEALLNSVGETAALRVMAASLKDCLELCLGHTAELLGMKRADGGSLTLGTAWDISKDGFKTDLDTLEQRARIANSLLGVWPHRLILEFVGVSDEERLDEIMRQIQTEGEIILEDLSIEEEEANRLGDGSGGDTNGGEV